MSQPDNKGEREQGLLEALRQAKEEHRALFRSHPRPMWIYDAQTLRFLAVNDAAVDHYGYSEPEFLGMTIKDIRPPEDVERLLARRERIGEGICRSGRWRHRKKDGTVIEVEIASHALEFAGRKARVVWAHDVTERERAEAALRESEQRLRTLAAATFEGIAVSEQGRIVDVNEQFGRMLGYAREELLGVEIAALIPAEDRGRVLDNIMAGRESHVEHAMLRKGGSRLQVEAHGQTVRLAGREARFTAVRDITERKRIEQALRESEAKYRQLVDLMPAAVYACDCDGRITFCNEHAVALWGRKPRAGDAGQDFCGCLRAFNAQGKAVPPERLPLALACCQGQSARNVEGLIERMDGSRVNVLVNLDPIRDPAGQVVGVITVLTDITEGKRIQTALENQNRRLGLLNEAAAQLLSADDPDQAMAGIYERIAGYFQTSGFWEFELDGTGQELVHKWCVGVGEPMPKDGITRLKVGEGIIGAVAQQRKPVVLAQVQQSPAENVQMLKRLGVSAYACFPLAVGQRLLGTFSFASRQRQRFEAEDVEFFETLAGYLALAKERLRLRAELERHAASLEQTVGERTSKLRELMAELEHMSYSIVHDMRAPLRAIQGYATIVEQREGERLSAGSRELLDRLVTATSRMDLLITDALNYNRAVRQEWVLQPVDVGKVLCGLLNSYPEFQAARAGVRLEGEFPPVLGNEAALAQCFANLLNNAVKFVKPGTRPEVRVWAEAGGEPEMVRVWVEDKGTGIPREGREKIFQMFQRMHGPEYEGTGIGLALVRKVVERLGGRVGVESEEGTGSRFWVELRPVRKPA